MGSFDNHDCVNSGDDSDDESWLKSDISGSDIDSEEESSDKDNVGNDDENITENVDNDDGIYYCIVNDSKLGWFWAIMVMWG